MGKSYDVWSNKEHKVIGTIYEKEDYEAKAEQSYAEAALPYIDSQLRMLRSLVGSFEADRKHNKQHEQHEKQKELILQKMTDIEKADYEKNIKTFEEEIKSLHDERKPLENEVEEIVAKIDQIKRKTSSLWFPIIGAILLNSSMIFAFMKTPDIGGVIFLAVTICLSFFIFKWIISLLSRTFVKIYCRKNYNPLLKRIEEIREQINKINVKARDYIYNYTTEFTSPWAKS